jgi:integrase
MRRKGTYTKTRQVLKEFGAHCPTTASMSPLAIADWIAAHPHRAPATIDSLLRHLSAVCTYGASRGYMSDPFDFRTVSSWLPEGEAEGESEEFSRHRSAAEVRAVLAQADSEALGRDWRACRLRAAVYCWAYTGAGKTEILGLRVKDIDLDKGLLSIRSHRGRKLKRGARAAALPIVPPLRRVLGPWLDRTDCDWPASPSDDRQYAFPHSYLNGPWFYGGPGRRPIDQVKALGERAGVPHLTILSFRHTLATLAEGWGIGELMLQRLLRHARRRTQQTYRHPDLEQMRDAAEKIDFD